MDNQIFAAIEQSQATLVAERVRLEILGDRPVSAEGHLMKRIPDSAYKTNEAGETVIFQGGYGLILDRPVLLEGHHVQVLALTRVKCASRPETDPFEDLRDKEIYAQVHASSRYSSFESLWLFDRLLNSPTETLKDCFDLWYSGRLQILKSY
jgi:hypothetical protein